MVVNTDLYDLLDVNPDASNAEIRKAYKKKSIKHHPDKPNGDEKLFKEMKLAYETLSDPDKREHYDSTGTVKGKKPDSGQMAISKILEYANKWLRQGNIHSDLVKYIKSEIQNELPSIEINIKNANISRENFEKIKDRISSKKENFIKMLFEKNITDINAFLVKADEEKKMLNQALLMMDDFSWEKIVQENSMGVNTGNSATTGWVTI